METERYKLLCLLREYDIQETLNDYISYLFDNGKVDHWVFLKNEKNWPTLLVIFLDDNTVFAC